MPHDPTNPAASHANPIATGEYAPESSTGRGSTDPGTGALKSPAGDLPDIPGYVVTGEIARGGMGRVLAATDLGFGREVAVKVLLAGFDAGEAAGRFVRESRITGRLTHPGIPPAHQLGTLADGSPFLAMKLVRGRTLAALLADRPRPAHDLPRFVGIFEQIAQAVGFAHSEGFVHRDLKPANVMVGAFGEVQVMDWGLAFEKDEGGRMKDEPGIVRDSSFTLPPSSLTAAGAVMGTPAYMAPEQARGEPVGAAADVFALGGILCEVLTGSRPFRGASGAEVVAKAAAGDVADALERLTACGADAELIDVARRCLSPAAADRPSDGTSVARLVAAYRAGVEERLRSAERDRAAAEARAEEQRKRKRVQLALAALAVVLVAAAGGVAVWRVQDAAERRVVRMKEADALAELLDQTKAALEAEDAARATPLLEQATRRAADRAVTDHAGRLADYTRDLAMLRALDAVNDFRWTPSGPRSLPPPDQVVERWEAVFAGYGIVPDTSPREEAVARIQNSPVRPALVAGLEGWLALSGAVAVRDLLAAVDPDSFRDEVRRKLATGDAAGLAGRAEWATQPSGLVVAYTSSRSVPATLARELLTRLMVARRIDFGLMMQVAETYPMNVAEGAGERVRWYQAAAALRPRNTAALNRLGITLLDIGDVDGAIAAFREAIHIDPEYVNLHHNLGNALRAKGQTDGAIAAYREAIRRDPKYASPHTGLGIALEDKGDLDGAIAAHREAIRIDPKYAEPHSNLGSVLSAKGDVGGAIAAHREAIRIDPQSAPLHYNLGVTLLDEGDVGGAIAGLREAIRLDPKYTLAHISLGNALRKKGDLGGAIAAYREAVRLDPKDARPHTNLGLALIQKGDVDGGIAAHREAIRIDPRYPLPHFNLGIALQRKGDVDGAMAAHREVIRLDPKDAKPHHELGLALMSKGDVGGAIAAFRESIRLDPKYALPHIGLGTGHEKRLELDEAEAAYRESLRLNPRLAFTHASLGNVYRRQGRHAEAVAAYRTALAIQPNHSSARDGLDYCLRVQRGEVPTAPPPRVVAR